MENIVVRQDLPCGQEDRELSLPDVEATVTACVSAATDAFSVQKILTEIIGRAVEDISRLSEAQAYMYVKCCTRIAKGLRRNTEDNQAYRFFHFGQFQTHVELLERKLEQIYSEERILSVANRKHFASIMQLLYTEQICKQQKLSDKLRIDRSNLSRELKRLENSNLVEVTTVGRSRYYRLTPQGSRYYNTYLVMKSQLEEQIYSPWVNNSLMKEPSLRHFSFPTLDSQDCFSLNDCRDESSFANIDTKSRPDEVFDYLRRDT